MNYLLVALGGVVGAPLRYLADRWVQSRHRSPLPWGTFAVNIAGSALLGGLAGLGLAATNPWWLLLGTGFCGAFTTYSTFGYETVRLFELRRFAAALANAAGSIAVGLAAARLAFALA